MDRLRIGAHYSSSFCLISATKFKLLFPPPFENLVLNFSQFCENQLHPTKVHLPIVSQISLRERGGGGGRKGRRGGREEGEEGRRGRKGGGGGREEGEKRRRSEGGRGEGEMEGEMEGVRIIMKVHY